MGDCMTEAEGKPATLPGRTAERISVFTDAVFAIAMTLLVIEIPRPEGADFDTGDGVSKSEAVHRLAHFLGQQAGAHLFVEENVDPKRPKLPPAFGLKGIRPLN